MFQIPSKRLVINSDTQVRIMKYDGSGTYVNIGSPALATDGFQVEGFLSFPILFGNLSAVVSTTLIKSVAGAAGLQQIATWTMNAVTGGDASGENFWIQYNALKLSPTEYQNQPLIKHYQVSATLGTNPSAIAVATSIQNAINADPNAPVTVQRSNAVLTFTAVQAGVTFQFYNTPSNRGGLISGTFAVTQGATLDVNTYEDLKNIQWPKGDHLGSFDFDRHAEIFPVFGQTYKSYRFKIKSTPKMRESLLIPSEFPATGEVITEFILYVANGLNTQTLMDLVTANANAAT